jgi:hypothetical protein
MDAGDRQRTGAEGEEAGHSNGGPEQGTVERRRRLTVDPAEGGVAQQPEDGAREDGEGLAHAGLAGNRYANRGAAISS